MITTDLTTESHTKTDDSTQTKYFGREQKIQEDQVGETASA